MQLCSQALFAVISIMGVVSALNLTDRGCLANETGNRLSVVSYQTLNATGSTVVKDIAPQDDSLRSTTWTYSTGIQDLWNVSTNRLANEIVQPIWLNTSGVDLAAKDFPYDACYILLLDQPQSVQQRGQGDNGDCSTFLGQTCASDWRKNLIQQGLSLDRNSMTPQAICDKLKIYQPDSCKGSAGSRNITGSIPPSNRNCSFGLGDPDYDLVAQIDTVDGNAKNGTTDFTLYDKAVTRIVPILTVTWSNGDPSQQNWINAQLACLSTTNIVQGSRKAPSVPSVAAERLWVDRAALGVIASACVMMWLAI